MMHYEWKPMAEAENNTGIEPTSRADGSVAVIVPLFPRLPGIRQSLVSLATQTRPPNLVVLLDDGTSAEAESLQEVIPGLTAEIVQTEPGSLPSAINAAVEYLANFDFVTFLQAGDLYAPERLERCAAELASSTDRRGPAIVVTGWRPVDSRGQLPPDDDERVRHMELLWAPGRAGAGLSDWLGCGYFPGPFSNLFAKRDYFAANPLPDNLSDFQQFAVLVAALQSQLSVLHEPLLEHYAVAPQREPTPRQTTDALRLQLAVLSALRPRLAISPETRRNAAAYHRSAWNNISGVREDLFQQLVLQLATTAEPQEVEDVLSPILRSYEAQTMPAHWEALLDGQDPLDLAAYADALRRTREKLMDARTENERLRGIAEAAQSSGWVRFGAWLGDRASRRVMELEEEETVAEQTPKSSAAPAPDNPPGDKVLPAS